MPRKAAEPKLIDVKYKSSCPACHSDQVVTLGMKPEGRKLCPKTFEQECLLDGHRLTFKLVTAKKRPAAKRLTK